MPNQKKMLYIDPYYLGIAKSIYKRGKCAEMSNSNFIRCVLEDIANGIKKAVTK